jgi:hypothetical protein
MDGKLLGNILGFLICLISAHFAYRRAKRREYASPLGTAIVAFCFTAVYWTLVLIATIFRALRGTLARPAS